MDPARMNFQYDRDADILYVARCPPYAEQETEELGEDAICPGQSRDRRRRRLGGAVLFDASAAWRYVLGAGDGRLASRCLTAL